MKGYGITDKGKVRRENQDSFVLKLLPRAEQAILVVCDGMGGARAGEIASRLAAERFASHVAEGLQPGQDPLLSDLVREAAVLANTEIYERASRDEACRGMGTTLVALVIRGKSAVIANVGDSRAYRIRGEEIIRITRDHSLVEEMVNAGKLTPEEAATHPQKNLITRALGVDEFVSCDVYEPHLEKGDIFLLCTDGLSNQTTAEEMLEQQKKSKTANGFCKKLLKIALERGAPDNVTACAVQL